MEFQARGQQFGGVSDGSTWSQLMRSTLVDVDLETYKGQLTENEFNALVRAQRAEEGKQENGQSSGEVRAIFKNARGIMRNAVSTIPGISEEDNEQAAGTRFFLDRKMDEYVQTFTDQGKEPNQDQLGKEATRLIMQVKTGADVASGFTMFGHRFFGGEGFFEGVAGQQNQIPIAQQQGMVIPIDLMRAEQKAELRQIYNGFGVTPTDGMLEQLGGAMAMNDAVRVLRLITPRVEESE